MPSSSTHDTVFEHMVVRHFIMTFCRLHRSGMHRECEILTSRFAALIDLTAAELLGSLRFEVNPILGRTTIDDVSAAKHFWLEVKDATIRQKRCNRIWSAGSHLLDVSAGLLQLGRRGEAEDFGELGMKLREIAEDVLEQEETTTISLRGGSERDNEEMGSDGTDTHDD